MSEKYSYGYAKNLYKKFKEKEEMFNMKLESKKFYIMRFDGKGMTEKNKIHHKAINESFYNNMKKTFEEFCFNHNNIVKIGYSFSDEISILFKTEEKEALFDFRIEKLLSLFAAEISVIYERNMKDNDLDVSEMPLFDARIISIERENILNYFEARQAYAIDKYLMQLKGEYSIDYRLHTSSKVIQSLKEKNILYEDLKDEYKYGLLFAKGEMKKSFDFSENEKIFESFLF